MISSFRLGGMRSAYKDDCVVPEQDPGKLSVQSQVIIEQDGQIQLPVAD